MTNSDAASTQMDESRFKLLIVSYGADYSKWPDEQRQLALEFFEQNPKLRRALDAERELDSQLDLYQLESMDLTLIESTILKQTIHKEDTIDKLLRWLTPKDSIWRPAIAACLPILVGLTIGSNIEFDDQLTLSEEMEIVSFDTTYSLISGDSLDEL